jgi:hypothetical protein
VGGLWFLVFNCSVLTQIILLGLRKLSDDHDIAQPNEMSIPSVVKSWSGAWKPISAHSSFLEALCSYSGVSIATLARVLNLLNDCHPLKLISKTIQPGIGGCGYTCVNDLSPVYVADKWAATTGICVVVWISAAQGMLRLFPTSLPLFSQGPVCHILISAGRKNVWVLEPLYPSFSFGAINYDIVSVLRRDAQVSFNSAVKCAQLRVPFKIVNVHIGEATDLCSALCEFAELTVKNVTGVSLLIYMYKEVIVPDHCMCHDYDISYVMQEHSAAARLVVSSCLAWTAACSIPVVVWLLSKNDECTRIWPHSNSAMMTLEGRVCHIAATHDFQQFFVLRRFSAWGSKDYSYVPFCSEYVDVPALLHRAVALLNFINCSSIMISSLCRSPNAVASRMMPLLCHISQLDLEFSTFAQGMRSVNYVPGGGCPGISICASHIVFPMLETVALTARDFLSCSWISSSFPVLHSLLMRNQIDVMDEFIKECCFLQVIPMYIDIFSNTSGVFLISLLCSNLYALHSVSGRCKGCQHMLDSLCSNGAVTLPQPWQLLKVDGEVNGLIERLRLESNTSVCSRVVLTESSWHTLTTNQCTVERVYVNINQLLSISSLASNSPMLFSLASLRATVNVKLYNVKKVAFPVPGVSILCNFCLGRDNFTACKFCVEMLALLGTFAPPSQISFNAAASELKIHSRQISLMALPLGCVGFESDCCSLPVAALHISKLVMDRNVLRRFCVIAGLSFDASHVCLELLLASVQHGLPQFVCLKMPGTSRWFTRSILCEMRLPANGSVCHFCVLLKEELVNLVNVLYAAALAECGQLAGSLYELVRAAKVNASRRVCSGLTAFKYAHIDFNSRPFGQLRIAHFWKCGDERLKIMPALATILHMLDPLVFDQALKELAIPLYFSERGSQRSVLCNIYVPADSACCTQCAALLIDRSLSARSVRLKTQKKRLLHRCTPYLGGNDQRTVHISLVRRVKARRDISARMSTQYDRLKIKWAGNCVYFKSAAKAGNADNFVTMIRLLIGAHQQQRVTGNLDDTISSKRACQTAIASRLVRIICDKRAAESDTNVHKGGCHDPHFVAYMAQLSSYMGSVVYKGVADLLGAPDHRAIKRIKATYAKFQCGFVERQVQAAADILEGLGLKNALCVISEDATALRHRVDLEDDNMELVLHGCHKGPHRVSSTSELIELVTSQGLATSFYVHHIVPIVRGAKCIPIVAQTLSANFTHCDVLTWWRTLWLLCARYGIRLVGHVSDGDPKLRKNMLAATEGTEAGMAATTIDHPLVTRSIPHIEGVGPVCFTQDYMHVFWRLRVQYLAHDRVLSFGGVPTIGVTLSAEMIRDRGTLTGVQSPPNIGDLNPRNKQNWHGSLRLFGIDKGTGHAIPSDHSFVDRMKSRSYPDFVYCNFVRTYMSAFIPYGPVGEESIEDYVTSVVTKCGYCIAFMGYWWHILSKGSEKGVTPSTSSITLETCRDVILGCTMQILLVKVWREFFPDFPFFPQRFTTRYIEHFFGLLRRQDTTSPTLSAASALRGVAAIAMHLMDEYSGKSPAPNRRQDVGPDDVAPDAQFGVVTNWALFSDELISAMLDNAAAAAAQDLGAITRKSKWVPPSSKQLKVVLASIMSPKKGTVDYEKFYAPSFALATNSILATLIRDSSGVRFAAPRAGTLESAFDGVKRQLHGIQPFPVGIPLEHLSLHHLQWVLEQVSPSAVRAIISSDTTWYAVDSTPARGECVIIHDLPQILEWDGYPVRLPCESALRSVLTTPHVAGVVVLPIKLKGTPTFIALSVIEFILCVLDFCVVELPEVTANRVYGRIMSLLCGGRSEDDMLDASSIYRAAVYLPNDGSGIYSAADINPIYTSTFSVFFKTVASPSPSIIRGVLFGESAALVSFIHMFGAYQSMRCTGVQCLTTTDVSTFRKETQYIAVMFFNPDILEERICIAILERKTGCVYLSGCVSLPVEWKAVFEAACELEVCRFDKFLTFCTADLMFDHNVLALVTIDVFITRVDKKRDPFACRNIQQPHHVAMYTRHLLMFILNFVEMLTTLCPVFALQSLKYVVAPAGFNEPFEAQGDLTSEDFCMVSSVLAEDEPEKKLMNSVIRVCNFSYEAHSNDRKGRFMDELFIRNVISQRQAVSVTDEMPAVCVEFDTVYLGDCIAAVHDIDGVKHLQVEVCFRITEIFTNTGKLKRDKKQSATLAQLGNPNWHFCGIWIVPEKMKTKKTSSVNVNYKLHPYSYRKDKIFFCHTILCKLQVKNTQDRYSMATYAHDFLIFMQLALRYSLNHIYASVMCVCVRVRFYKCVSPPLSLYLSLNVFLYRFFSLSLLFFLFFFLTFFSLFIYLSRSFSLSLSLSLSPPLSLFISLFLNLLLFLNFSLALFFSFLSLCLFLSLSVSLSQCFSLSLSLSFSLFLRFLRFSRSLFIFHVHSLSLSLFLSLS